MLDFESRRTVHRERVEMTMEKKKQKSVKLDRLLLEPTRAYTVLVRTVVKLRAKMTL